jgi:protein-S-isoprenylcysteine O-methyltransferase Ste14
MKATSWEFRNRAMLFGMIYAFTFPMYMFDPQNSTVVLANWLGARLQMDADLTPRLLFTFATLLLAAGAFIRTWGSAYLHADVVYAAEVKSERLVADGPYRLVRNPLYFGNVFMVLGMGAMMSRTGFATAVVAMIVFCYRLILREESELQASQGEKYENYKKAVPRLWSALWPRIPSAGRQAMWGDGFKAESWCWGFTVSVMAFAITLKLPVFFVILGASLVLFWIPSLVLQKKVSSQE